MSSAETRAVSFPARFALLAAAALLLLGLGAAPAAAAPEWGITSLSPTTAAPGATVTFRVELTDRGTSRPNATVEPWIFTATLPAGLTPKAAYSTFSEGWNCSSFTATLTCKDTSDRSTTESFPNTYISNVVVEADVDPDASGVLTSRFEIAGGGAPARAAADPLTVSADPPGFGIEGFDQRSSADLAGTLSSQAGGRPYEVITDIDYNSLVEPTYVGTRGSPRSVEPVKDIVVDLPAGLLGNPAGVARCAFPDLANADQLETHSLCAPSSQVGSLTLRSDLSASGIPVSTTFGPFPVFNLVPPPDAPARFGFNAFGTVVTIDPTVRSEGDYGIRAVSRYVPVGLSFVGNSLNLWGVPADPVHTRLRGCPGGVALALGGPSCPSEAPQVSFWRNPTSCEDEATGLATKLEADSWFHPGVFGEATSLSHQSPGYPLTPSEWGAPRGPSGCAKVLFKPSFEATPTTNASDAPSGLDLHLKVPQGCWEQRDTICQSDLRDAGVQLPAGMSLNPSSASGLAACSSQQVGLITPVGSSPIHFDEAPVACPESSKLGSVEIETPLLEKTMKGSIYLAKQSDNPFGSLLAMYLVAEGSGVVVKQAGEIEVGPGGRLTTVFRDAPQVPFSDLHVELFGGTRAPLRTPSSCGTYSTRATLTPWSGNPDSVLGSAFSITGCGAGGFAPKFGAGTENPLAGATSPFHLRLQRDDGTEELADLEVSLPPGLLGNLKGTSLCPEAAIAAVSGELGTGAGEEASPSCPASSLLGTVSAGAGAGPNPFYTSSGRIYLAGPYKGAPVSLVVITPAVAGPFDLGSVVVRDAIQIDPQTAQVTIASDPLPTILHGIPLDLRDIRVDADRDRFILNPTSCDEMQVASTITGALGTTANPSQRFQLAGCERLGFRPRLSLQLKGGTRRSENPALVAVMRPRPGDANLSRIQVSLPHSEFLAQNHIRTICTRVQFAADACPKGSIYGRATATTSIDDYPFSGNVYLRSSDNPLPDLVLALRGPAHQPIEVDAVGRIDTDPAGGIRTTFSVLPDAPLTKVVLRMQGGKKSLLENSTNLCRGKQRATVEMDAHNGKFHDFRPALKVECPGGRHRRG